MLSVYTGISPHLLLLFLCFCSSEEDVPILCCCLLLSIGKRLVKVVAVPLTVPVARHTSLCLRNILSHSCFCHHHCRLWLMNYSCIYSILYSTLVIFIPFLLSFCLTFFLCRCVPSQHFFYKFIGLYHSSATPFFPLFLLF